MLKIRMCADAEFKAYLGKRLAAGLLCLVEEHLDEDGLGMGRLNIAARR
jgi:hypothetical protein